MKRLLIVISAILMIGCSAKMVKTAPAPTEPDFSCEFPNSYEYICYSSNECGQYMGGYSSVIYERFRSGMYDKVDGKEKTIVYVNLFYDHEGYSIIGKMVAEKRGKKIWLEFHSIICDLEGNKVWENYTADYMYKELP
jgi:hypothetical protein